MNKCHLIVVALLANLFLFSQKKMEHIAFINGSAHLGNGQVIEAALFVINKDKIESVQDIRGIKLNPMSFDTVIDLAGQHIYPALINPNNILGLHDAEAVRATLDYAEVGQLNPHVRALIAYNTDNLIVPTIKTNGVLYTQVTPRGGLISGSSSIMALEGWNWEDAAVKADDGVHLNFPRYVEPRQNENEDVYKKRQQRYTDDVRDLQRFFAEARSYLNGNTSSETNLRFEAMRPVLFGKARLYLHADKARDILKVLAFVEEQKISFPVLVGGKESYKVLKELKKSGIPVMLNRINDLPERSDDAVDAVFQLPSQLQNDSILFCLQLEGDMEAAQSRNLAFNAGCAVNGSFNKEQALSAISFNAAKIMGIDNLLGSLESGKLASFVICEGDLLDMRSSSVSAAYISGKKIDLNNRQTELYKKYLNKYNLH